MFYEYLKNTKYLGLTRIKIFISISEGKSYL